MQEKFTDLQTIEQIFLTNGGGQYLELPTVSVTSSTGNGAILLKHMVMKLVKL